MVFGLAEKNVSHRLEASLFTCLTGETVQPTLICRQHFYV